eukprot:1141934-Pelagomonas_calceolata.AAC.5
MQVSPQGLVFTNHRHAGVPARPVAACGWARGERQQQQLALVRCRRSAQCSTAASGAGLFCCPDAAAGYQAGSGGQLQVCACACVCVCARVCEGEWAWHTL